MTDGIYTPYVEAIRVILAGDRVADLDGIKARCDKAFAEARPEERRAERFPMGSMDALSAMASSENRLCGGEDPDTVYDDLNIEHLAVQEFDCGRYNARYNVEFTLNKLVNDYTGVAPAFPREK